MNNLFPFLFIKVVYKGYFVPVEATECPPLSTVTAAPTPAPSGTSAAQSWGDAPARIAKPSRKAQQNTDVEVFDSDMKTSTTTPDPLKKQPNINIEIHNVFSFGTANNTSFPTRTGENDSKIIGSKTDQNHSNPPIIYA